MSEVGVAKGLASLLVWTVAKGTICKCLYRSQIVAVHNLPNLGPTKFVHAASQHGWPSISASITACLPYYIPLGRLFWGCWDCEPIHGLGRERPSLENYQEATTRMTMIMTTVVNHQGLLGTRLGKDVCLAASKTPFPTSLPM